MIHYSGIYQIRNLINGHIYVGQTQNMKARKDNHFTNLKYNKHHTPYLQAAYNKYGRENFVFEPLVYCEIFELDRIEQEIIDKINPEYNSLKIISPGLRGYKFSEESRKRMSLAQKGRTFSDETKKKMSEVRLAKHIKLTPEQIAKLPTFKKGHTINKGRKLSIERKEQISKLFRGKVMSEEQKRKIGDANKRIQAEKKNKIKCEITKI